MIPAPTNFSKRDGLGLQAIRLYLLTAYLLWQGSCYYINGPSGLLYPFGGSFWGRTFEIGYVLGLLVLIFQVVKQLKSGRQAGVPRDLIFIGLGLAFLLPGAGASPQTIASTGRVALLGINLAFLYLSWRAWRQLKSRAPGYLFFGYALNLAREAGLKYYLTPRSSAANGWAPAENVWFMEYYWLGGIIAGVLIAAGIIQLLRHLRAETPLSVLPLKASNLALAILALLIGLYPSTIYFHSPGFVTSVSISIFVLGHSLLALRKAKSAAIASWAWAAGVTLVMALTTQFYRTPNYLPSGSDQHLQSWLAIGSVLAGVLWLIGFVLAMRQPDVFQARAGQPGDVVLQPKLLPVWPGWMRSRLFIISSMGALLIGGFWLRNHDPTQVFSLEPKYEGHTLTYWMERSDAWDARGGWQAHEALRSMGTKALPLLVDWIGRPYTSGFNYPERALKAFELLGPVAKPAVPKLIAIIGRGDYPQRALVCIGADAVPALAAKYVETLSFTNLPAFDSGWRRSGERINPANIRQRVVSTLMRMGTNAEAALPALMLGANSKQPWTQLSAITALGAIGRGQPDKLIPVLTNLLISANSQTFERAALSLGSVRRGRPEIVIPILANVLSGTNANALNQSALASALAKAGQDRAAMVVPILIQVFEHPQTNSPQPITRQPASANRVYQFNRTNDSFADVYSANIRVNVAGLLGGFGNKARSAIPVLLAASQNQDPNLRSHIALAILKIAPGTPGALTPLLKNLDERDVQIRRQALETLESLGTNAIAAIPKLIEKSRQDSDVEVRKQAMECLARTGQLTDEIILVLNENLASTNSVINSAAYNVLCGLADQSKKAFTALLTGMWHCPSVETRQQIDRCLQSAAERNSTLLSQSLASDDPEIRYAALRLIDQCRFSLPEVRPALKKAMRDNNPEARAFATNRLITLDAALYGRAVAELLVTGGNLETTNAQGQTALLVQMENGREIDFGQGKLQMAAMRALLAAGANPDCKDLQGRTPAHLALMGVWPWRGSEEKLSMLVQAGASLSVRDAEGKTPLHYLASLGDKSPLFFIHGVGAMFAEAKVEIEAQDNEGNTPLLLATKSGTSDVSNWLLEHGASLDITNHAGESPRTVALRNPNRYEGTSDFGMETDIFAAIRRSRVDAAARILKANPLLANQIDRMHQSTLRVATTLHLTNMIALLEEHGARWDAASAVMARRADALRTILRENPTAITNEAQGRGLLHFAAADGNEEVVQVLLAAKADPQAVDSWGVSPLGRALINHQTNVVTVLTAQGAKLNIFDAVYLNDLKTVGQLLARQRRLAKSQNSLNESLVEIAVATGHTEILQLLLKNGGSIGDSEGPKENGPGVGTNPLNLAAYHNQTNLIEILIQAGAKINHCDRHGFAPLHWAAVAGATATAKQLLEHQADINVRVAATPFSDKSFMGLEATLVNDTPLHLAALNHSTNMIQLLLKSGAQVNAENGSFQTPLEVARDRRPFLESSLFRANVTMTILMEPLVARLQTTNQTLRPMQTDPEPAAKLIRAAGGRYSPNRE